MIIGLILALAFCGVIVYAVLECRRAIRDELDDFFIEDWYEDEL